MFCVKDALLHPKHPERICWGCERYCRANDLACREERVLHPIEPFGYDPHSSNAEQISGAGGTTSLTNVPGARVANVATHPRFIPVPTST